jgi:hypothetical protein
MHLNSEKRTSQYWDTKIGFQFVNLLTTN